MEQPSKSLITALGGKMTEKPETTDEQFKLPDLVSEAMKEGEERLKKEWDY